MGGAGLVALGGLGIGGSAAAAPVTILALPTMSETKADCVGATHGLQATAAARQLFHRGCDWHHLAVDHDGAVEFREAGACEARG